MSAEIASGQSPATQPAKVAPFAGGNEVDVRQKRRRRLLPN
jgi:hypothetical protein